MEIVDLTTNHPARKALAELADRGDKDIDVVAGALLIAAEELDLEAPDLEAYVEMLDDLGSRAREKLPDDPQPADRIAAVHQVLFGELGLSGENVDLDDPDIVLLPRVLESRRGLPISLSIVYVAVADRCGLEAFGVAFPGHFLVRLELADGIVVVDPFNDGRTLDVADCRELLEETTGEGAEFDSSLLQPASPRVILTRFLSNLRALYLRRSDEARALRAHERMVMLNPRSTSLIRGRAALYSRLGRADRAASDLERVLALELTPNEEVEVRLELARLRSDGRWVN